MNLRFIINIQLSKQCGIGEERDTDLMNKIESGSRLTNTCRTKYYPRNKGNSVNKV